MPVDLSKSLVIGISSRALFDLEEANSVFDKEGVDAYAKYQRAHEEDILNPGTGFPLIKAILGLNKMVEGHRPAEVVVMSRNSPETSPRLFHSIKHYGLDIQRACLTGGTPVVRYLKPFKIDLYLSAYEEDVREALTAKIASAVIYGAPTETSELSPEIRIAFDGDAVLFSDEAERVYQTEGLDAFIEHETRNANNPLPEGPFARLLRTLRVLQKNPKFTKPPIRTALITARNMPAHIRVLNTFRAWDLNVDEAFFMGGVEKTEILRAFRPHIFFDDQEAHCDRAAGVVSTARVPVESMVVSAAPAPPDVKIVEYAKELTSTDTPQTPASSTGSLAETTE